MHPEALILRRCYPVPVTFADLRAAYMFAHARVVGIISAIPEIWADALHAVTGSNDAVYAARDGREWRIAYILKHSDYTQICPIDADRPTEKVIRNLLEVADEQGYWERPHEVRLDLSPRLVSHGEVARAVLVGQEYVERHGNR